MDQQDYGWSRQKFRMKTSEWLILLVVPTVGTLQLKIQSARRVLLEGG
jgi:hypothetical protein